MSVSDEETNVHQGTRRGRRAALAVLVVGAVVLVGVVGFLLGRAGPSAFEAEVVAISSDGDSLCIDRAEDTCGQPLITPDDRDRLEPGMTVLVREMWVEQDAGERLVFIVDIPD